MRSFIIHMSASTARRPNAERLLSDLPRAELSEAVDGRDPAVLGQVDLHPGDLCRPRYPFALRPAEIGCFLSHRQIWRKMVDEGIDIALIAEDDLRIDPDRFAAALDLVARHATPGHYIRLPVKQRETPARSVDRSGDTRLILPRMIGLQTVCQVVGREAAARLLKATASIDRPVDTTLQMHWITGQPVHSILGTGNREVAAQYGGSTIQRNTHPGEKLVRETRRALYRARIRLHPQRP